LKISPNCTKLCSDSFGQFRTVLPGGKSLWFQSSLPPLRAISGLARQHGTQVHDRAHDPAHSWGPEISWARATGRFGAHTEIRSFGQFQNSFVQFRTVWGAFQNDRGETQNARNTAIRSRYRLQGRVHETTVVTLVLESCNIIIFPVGYGVWQPPIAQHPAFNSFVQFRTLSSTKAVRKLFEISYGPQTFGKSRYGSCPGDHA